MIKDELNLFNEHKVIKEYNAFIKCILREESQVEFVLFFAHLPELAGYPNKKICSINPWYKECFRLSNKRLALSLGYNELPGFYTSSTIPREQVMWIFPKDSQMYLIRIIILWVYDFL